MEFNYTEMIGYVASFIVLISFLMKNMIKLRIVNSVGCGLFVIYGILLHNSVPIILTNSVILFIHLYYLLKEYNSTK
ncbi:MAG: uroporphyrinogen decarboxylase [Bacteroidia bacterium]|nr:uroporphyrinogen decarboxylase [Bacteroidia bacterium]